MAEKCDNGICEVGGERAPPHCPRCGRRGKSVEGITVRYLVQGRFQGRVKESLSYYFCPSPTCSTVYYSENGESPFSKEELSERVTVKERDDPVPICYCFNFFRHDVEQEIQATGHSTIPDFISDQVKAGNCFCEYTNPQGTCCLGNVAMVIKQIQKGG